MSVHGPIFKTLATRPFRALIYDDHRAWRGLDLLAASLRLADVIEQTSRSRTVGVMLPTSGLFPAAALACWALGRVVVPLNYLLKRDELEYVVRHCETDTVVAVGPMLEHVGGDLHGVNTLRLEDVNFKTPPSPRWPAPAHDDDLATLLYTSGTSGRPKGVMLSHGNLAANIRQVRRWVDFTPRDTLFGVLPQFHSFGFTVLTLLPLTIGCQVVYAARFIPKKIVETMRRRRPTVLVAIPSMYGALLSVKNAGPEDFSSLRYIVSGGEPLPEAVATAFFDRFGARINEGYGLTETAPVTNWCRPQEYKPRSVGRALPEVIERIVDPAAGNRLGPGRDGEVRLKGPNVMAGYFKAPAETASVFDVEGFFKTGDMGRLNADGHLYITGRIKEMLIVGGENIFPREIEEVLDKHPSVAASAVVGLRDDVRGEVPLAFVELVEGAAFDEQALRAWCRDRLAGYKAPREIRRVDALPRSATGKILRRELAERLRSGVQEPAPSDPPHSPDRPTTAAPPPGRTSRQSTR